MSFTFNWPRFSDQFHYDAIQMLNTALNKGSKPPIIADKIEVVELEMGTQPPELEIRDIGDLALDHFRGIFRLTYAGDAHLVLRTKVQANPLNHKQPDIHLMTGSRGMLAAKEPLVVPMLLRLSHFRLSSYVVLVVSKQKGITLVFKTDPLQNVDINSTFDSISVIQKFIQREIEEQLRQMFREDLPGIIHRLSQQWVKAKVEAPYLSKRPALPTGRRAFETMSNPEGLAQHQAIPRKPYSTFGSRRPRSVSGVLTSKVSSLRPPVESHSSSHTDIENFDPTYGLRPESLPVKSGFSSFSSLFAPNKGLADLAEETSQEGSAFEEEEGTSFDVVEWEDTVPGFSPTPSIYNGRTGSRDAMMEYETVPAVGGGTITRPRIYHSQAAIQTHPPISLLSQSSSQTSFRNGVSTSSMMSRTPSTVSVPYLYAGSARFAGYHSAAASTYSNLLKPPLAAPVSLSFSVQRPRSPDSLESESRSSNGFARTFSTDATDPALHNETTAPCSTSYFPSPATAIYMRRPPSERRMSVMSTSSTRITTSDVLSISPSHMQQDFGNDSVANPKIVLKPSSNNNSIQQLSTLSHSNHTLSPYTRDLSHFTVRSVPPRNLNVGGQGGPGFGLNGNERQPLKARRKRTYRIGGGNTAHPSTAKFPAKVEPTSISRQPSPTLPSEFDVSEMDRYFPLDDYESETRTYGPKSTRVPRHSIVLSGMRPSDLSTNSDLRPRLTFNSGHSK